MNKKHFSLVSNEQLKDLKLSKLYISNIDAIISSRQNIEEQKKLFSLFSPQNIQAALIDCDLDDKHLHLISNEKIKDLELSKLYFSDIEAIIFSRQNIDEQKKLFSLFSPQNIQAAIYKNRLNNKHFHLISNEKLKSLDLSEIHSSDIEAFISSRQNIDEQKKLFGLLSPQKVQAMIYSEELSKKYFSLVSNEQLKDLDLSKLCYTDIDPIVSSRQNIDEQKKLFSLFSPDMVQAAIKDCKVTQKHFHFLSDQQLASLKISEWYSWRIDELFSANQAENKRRCSILSTDEIQAAIDANNFDEKHFTLLSDEQKQSITIPT